MVLLLACVCICQQQWAKRHDTDRRYEALKEPESELYHPGGRKGRSLQRGNSFKSGRPTGDHGPHQQQPGQCGAENRGSSPAGLELGHGRGATCGRDGLPSVPQLDTTTTPMSDEDEESEEEYDSDEDSDAWTEESSFESPGGRVHVYLRKRKKQLWSPVKPKVFTKIPTGLLSSSAKSGATRAHATYVPNGRPAPDGVTGSTAARSSSAASDPVAGLLAAAPAPAADPQPVTEAKQATLAATTATTPAAAPIAAEAPSKAAASHSSPAPARKPASPAAARAGAKAAAAESAEKGAHEPSPSKARTPDKKRKVGAKEVAL